MKIAFVTDDGENVSAHFGRATHYLVVDVENGKETGRELREKLGHAHFHTEEHQHEEHSAEGHGFDPQSQSATLPCWMPLKIAAW
jgi:predicted Fe-Mo cluster-binding NifX family protein